MLSYGTEAYYHFFKLVKSSGKTVKAISTMGKVQSMGCKTRITFCRLLSLTLINIHDTRLHQVSSYLINIYQPGGGGTLTFKSGTVMSGSQDPFFKPLPLLFRSPVAA